MREIDVSVIERAVAELSKEANYTLTKDVVSAFRNGIKREESAVGREVFGMLLENADIAAKEMVPICQDTGLAVIFLEIGQDVHLVGGDVEAAVNRGVARGYTEGYLRKSSLADPLRRKNTGDNTPAVLHYAITPGDKAQGDRRPEGGRQREHERPPDAQAVRRRGRGQEVRCRHRQRRRIEPVSADRRRRRHRRRLRTGRHIGQEGFAAADRRAASGSVLCRHGTRPPRIDQHAGHRSDGPGGRGSPPSTSTSKPGRVTSPACRRR